MRVAIVGPAVAARRCRDGGPSNVKSLLNRGSRIVAGITCLIRRDSTASGSRDVNGRSVHRTLASR